MSFTLENACKRSKKKYGDHIKNKIKIKSKRIHKTASYSVRAKLLVN